MIEHEVVIIGAGPAGIAAAARLRALGVSDVVIVERERDPGGVPRHCGHRGFGWIEFRRLLTGPQYAGRLARSLGVQDVRCGTPVVALRPDGVVEIGTASGIGQLKARAVLLATGTRESPRSARLLGGARPWGVMNTGTLQQLVHLQHRRPCRRAVIIGSELVAYSALMTLRHAGARAVAMLESQPRSRAFPAMGAMVARLFGAHLHVDAAPIRVIGDRRVEGLEIEQQGERHIIDCDAVICSGEFVPESALLRGSHLPIDPGTGGPVIDQFGRCADPAYFAAGNVLRAVEPSWTAWREGAAVAGAIHAALRGRLPPPERIRTVVANAPLRYVCPQLLAGAPEVPAAIPLHACADRPVNGRIEVRDAGSVIADVRVDAWANRRIDLARVYLPAGESPIVVRFEPAGR